MKLHVLTSLVSETNVQLAIREFQVIPDNSGLLIRAFSNFKAYLQMSDLAESAVEAIGRCALKVPSAAETCLGCLIKLISTSNHEQIVSLYFIFTFKFIINIFKFHKFKETFKDLRFRCGT